MSLRTATLLFALSVSTVVSAQTQSPAPPPQTAREALVEMITGGEKGLTKHLTVEVQDLLNKRENKQGAAMLTMFSAAQHQSGDMQSFPAGPTLLTVNEPAQHKKVEVHIDNDDLSGDQDVLQLSLRSLHGQEQPGEQDEWGFMSSRITVTMTKQQNIWRLSNVGIGIEVPLGDPEFLKKTFLKTANVAGAGLGVAVPTAHTTLVSSEPKAEKPQAFDPAGVVNLLGFAERSFASQHPDIGFTCSLPELTETGLDAQIASGSYEGYKWSVSGCEGKPAGSFQIVAEPILQGQGAKAVCTDATQNLRTSEDGRGSTCFTAGKVNAIQDGSDVMAAYGVDVHVNRDQPKP
jgi:hypothetical protein